MTFVSQTNTELNIYNSDDLNHNIKKAAVLYLQLPVKDNMGGPIAWTQEKLNALGLTDYNTLGTVGYQIKNYIETELDTTTDYSQNGTKGYTFDVTLTVDGKTYTRTLLLSYDFVVKFVTDNMTGADSSETAVLTNKNRTEFVLPMRSDYYEGIDTVDDEGNTVHVPGSNSAIVTYAAIYYDDDDENDGIWILSDNYVAYTHDLQPTISNGEG